MDRHVTIDPADVANAHGRAHGSLFHCSSRLEFEQPELNEIRDLWFGKAAGRPLPYRADFDLRSLRPALTHLTILERSADSEHHRYHIRFMGSEIARRLGEGSGRYLDDLIPAQLLPRWHAAHDTVLETLVPLKFITKFELPRLDYLVCECFQAPLLNADAKPTMLMVCGYFQGKVAR